MRFKSITLAAVLTAGAVWAWGYEDLFMLDQVGARPGGGGIWGTGGKQDHGVTCVMCHVVPDGGFSTRINPVWTFNPALATLSDGGSGYTPGTPYVIDLVMNNEHLGYKADGGPNSTNTFVAAFENAAGAYVGKLASDTGFGKGANCPATLNGTIFMSYDAGSTTVTYAGCNTITGRQRGAGSLDLKAWHFQWTAPAVGTGQVRMYWGVTDGSGEDSTLGDDTVQGVTVMEEQ